MSFDALKTADIIETMENFIASHRPPVEVRHQLDLGYRIEGQSIFIYQIRPRWDNPAEKMHSDFAKTTYVKNKNIWKVYWMRGNLKWYPYDPSTVKTFRKFTDLVSDDQYGCFRG